MNDRTKSHRLEYTLKERPKIKTLDVKLNAADRDLEDALKRVFALAKSAGQELNLTIVYGAS